MAGELHPQERKIEEKVAWACKRMETVRITDLRHVIALKGCNNAGKTSVLKCLIAELYRRDQQGWIERKPFDPSRVDVTCETEYYGVFVYKGIRVAIQTAGDTKDVMVRNFEYFAKYHVEIGVTAVRIHEEGKRHVVAEHVYAAVCSMYDFQCHEIAMPVGRRLRTRDAEMEVARQIIARLDELVAVLGARDK